MGSLRWQCKLGSLWLVAFLVGITGRKKLEPSLVVSALPLPALAVAAASSSNWSECVPVDHLWVRNYWLPINFLLTWPMSYHLLEYWPHWCLRCSSWLFQCVCACVPRSKQSDYAAKYERLLFRNAALHLDRAHVHTGHSEIRQRTLAASNRGWGPAGNTGSRARTRRRGEGGEGGEGDGLKIKSNNPHLTGGEQTSPQIQTTNLLWVHELIYLHFSFCHIWSVLQGGPLVVGTNGLMGPLFQWSYGAPTYI